MDTFTEIVSEIVSETFKLLGIALEVFFENGIKIVQFMFWVMAGVVIVPCIFISGTIYPMWEKWGENLRK